MTDIDIYMKLATLPENLKKEVEDFVDFIKSRTTQEETRTSRKAGLAKGLIHIREDFDKPLEDFKEYM